MDLSVFSPKERGILEDVIDRLRTRRVKEGKAKLVREIVPVDKWINSNYYAGPIADYLYPYWKDKVIETCRVPFQYNEYILEGALGIGKTFFSLVLFLRRLYELSCWENVPALFGLMPSSWLFFMYFSVSITQAKMGGFGQLREIIDSTPYFQNEFKREPGIDSAIIFPPSLWILCGSAVTHGIGLNVIGAILDEANFFQGETSVDKGQSRVTYSKAAALYQGIQNRAKSRFLSKGKDYSLSILVSSTTHTSSITQKRIKEAESLLNTKIVRGSLWDVKPKGTYSSETFWVFVGSNILDPCIVQDEADLQRILSANSYEKTINGPLDVEMKALPPAMKSLFVEVPKDFQDQFSSNVVQALQDLAGLSVAPMGKLFNSREAYNSCVWTDNYHPFRRDVLTVSTADPTPLYYWMYDTYKFSNPSAQRFIHCDVSQTNDRTGIAMCHTTSVRGESNKRAFPLVIYDFMLAIEPPKPPARIDLTKIVDFFVYLREKKHINIGSITYDSYQSAHSLQLLEQAGFATYVRSVDRTDDAYMLFIDALYHNSVRFYDYDIFRNELFELVHLRDKRKVDHPQNGSKDVADGVVGAFMGLLESASAQMGSAVDKFSSILWANRKATSILDIDDSDDLSLLEDVDIVDNLGIEEFKNWRGF